MLCLSVCHVTGLFLQGKTQQKLTVQTVEKYLFGDAPNVDSSEETIAVQNVALLDRRRHLQDLFFPKTCFNLLFLKSVTSCGVGKTYSNPASKNSLVSLKSLLTCYYALLNSCFRAVFSILKLNVF